MDALKTLRDLRNYRSELDTAIVKLTRLARKRGEIKPAASALGSRRLGVKLRSGSAR